MSDVLFSCALFLKVAPLRDDSYDVLAFGTGCTFNLEGDGGFQNVSLSLDFQTHANQGLNRLYIFSAHTFWNQDATRMAKSSIANLRPPSICESWLASDDPMQHSLIDQRVVDGCHFP